MITADVVCAAVESEYFSKMMNNYHMNLKQASHYRKEEEMIENQN